jgi:hypothetical protein
MVQKIVNNLKPKLVFAFEIIIKRSFGHIGGIQDFLDTGMVISLAMDDFGPDFDNSVSGVGLHAIFTDIVVKIRKFICIK